MKASPVVAVNVKNLTVKFGAFKAVDSISFNVKRGEIFGFLGANGAGKTTTIRVLCGLLQPTSGEVEVAQVNLKKGLDAVKFKVGYMSQKFTLYDDLTVAENLDFAASLRKIPEELFRKRSQELLDFIAFQKGLKTLVKDLPGGIKQQVSLACALLHDPEIVFLDEPTAGVTPAARARFWALIRRLAGEGKTVFVTTHYMDEAEQCERIALMREGKIIALDTPEGLKKLAFPNDLLEVTPRAQGKGQKVEMERLAAQRGVLSLKPYGLRSHLVVKNPEEWLKNLESDVRDAFDFQVIPPSLEDVFIQLVERGAK